MYFKEKYSVFTRVLASLILLSSLGSGLPAGEYVMQVVVTDSSKEKARVATQWIDFEVVNK